MTKNEPFKDIKKVCNLSYVSETLGGKKHLIKEILEAFLNQTSEELQCINVAVSKTDYPTIKRIAHSLQTTVSIMGIAELKSILKEMESLGCTAGGIDKIKQLNSQLNSICRQAFEEIENEKLNYI